MRVEILNLVITWRREPADQTLDGRRKVSSQQRGLECAGDSLFALARCHGVADDDDALPGLG
jgi:hypothetical protein